MRVLPSILAPCPSSTALAQGAGVMALYFPSAPLPFAASTPGLPEQGKGFAYAGSGGTATAVRCSPGRGSALEYIWVSDNDEDSFMGVDESPREGLGTGAMNGLPTRRCTWGNAQRTGHRSCSFMRSPDQCKGMLSRVAPLSVTDHHGADAGVQR